MKHKLYDGCDVEVVLFDMTRRKFHIAWFPPVKPEDGFFHFGDVESAFTVAASEVKAIHYKMVPFEDEPCEQPSA